MAKKKTTPRRTPVTPSLDHIAEDLRPLAVPIADLKLDPQNARTHDEANIAAIAASLKQYGQLKPIVAQRRTGEILAGNGALLAARKLGWSHLAVVWGKLDAAAGRGFSVADNRTAELAGWDTELLLAQIDLIAQDTPDLAAAWQLAELKASLDQSAPKDEKDQEQSAQSAPEEYQVVVECENEDQQKAVYEQLQREGRKCRLLTL